MHTKGLGAAYKEPCISSGKGLLMRAVRSPAKRGRQHVCSTMTWQSMQNHDSPVTPVITVSLLMTEYPLVTA
jgi:hypothetical protein